jgi:hypothetical protein
VIWAELPVPDRSAADAQDAAQEVLSRPEFHRPGPSIIERIEGWVSDALNRVLEAFSGVAGGGVIAVVILIAAAALVVVMLVRFGRGVQRDPGVPAARVRTGRGRTADEWRADATAHEAQGEWRAALRCRYRALVAELAGRGVLDDLPGKTTGEERTEVTDAVPAAGEPFGEATALFDEAWYGDVPTGPEETARLKELSAAVLDKAAANP